MVAKKKATRKKAKSAKDIINDAVNKRGRGQPTLYKDELCDELLDYFNIDPYQEVTRIHPKTGLEVTQKEANDLPTLSGFADKIKVSPESLRNWARAHPDFANAVSRCKSIAENMLVVNGLLGLYESRYAMFIAKNYTDLKDIKETRDLTDDEVPETPDEIKSNIEKLENRIDRLMKEL